MKPVGDILEIPMAGDGGSDRDLFEWFPQGDHDAFTTLYRTTRRTSSALPSTNHE